MLLVESGMVGRFPNGTVGEMDCRYALQSVGRDFPYSGQRNIFLTGTNVSEGAVLAGLLLASQCDAER